MTKLKLGSRSRAALLKLILGLSLLAVLLTAGACGATEPTTEQPKPAGSTIGSDQLVEGVDTLVLGNDVLKDFASAVRWINSLPTQTIRGYRIVKLLDGHVAKPYNGLWTATATVLVAPS